MGKRVYEGKNRRDRHADDGPEANSLPCIVARGREECRPLRSNSRSAGTLEIEIGALGRRCSSCWCHFIELKQTLQLRASRFDFDRSAYQWGGGWSNLWRLSAQD